MKKYTYNGNTKTTKVVTDGNGNIKSQQEEIVVGWTDNDMKDFSDKLFDAVNKTTAGHMVEPKNIDKEKEKSFARWVKNLIKRTKC